MFGIPLDNGSVDMTYSELTLGLEAQTDNCIYFSRRLCEELHGHGKAISKRYPRRFRKRAPRIVSCDFRQAEAAGLMPDPTAFADWERAFITPVQHSKGRRLGKIEAVLRSTSRRMDRSFDRWLSLASR